MRCYIWLLHLKLVNFKVWLGSVCLFWLESTRVCCWKHDCESGPPIFRRTKISSLDPEVKQIFIKHALIFVLLLLGLELTTNSLLWSCSKWYKHKNVKLNNWNPTSLIECFSVQALVVLCSACFRCFPAPALLTLINWLTIRTDDSW